MTKSLEYCLRHIIYKSRISRAITIGLILATSLVMVGPVSPAEAQAGSRLCGYRIEKEQPIRINGTLHSYTYSIAYVIEIPKGSSQVQKDICTTAQRRIKKSGILPEEGRISIRRMECEDLSEYVRPRATEPTDVCEHMKRANTAIEAINRSITFFSPDRISHHSEGKGWHNPIFSF